MYISGKVCVYIYPTVYIYLGLNCISNFSPIVSAHIFKESSQKMSQKWLCRPINPPSPLEINCYLSVSPWLAQKCPLNHLLPEAKTLFNCQEAFMIYTLLNLQRRQKNGLHALNAAVNYKRAGGVMTGSSGTKLQEARSGDLPEKMHVERILPRRTTERDKILQVWATKWINRGQQVLEY